MNEGLTGLERHGDGGAGGVINNRIIICGWTFPLSSTTNTTLFNIEQRISMLKWSCDTEDWRNDAENSAWHHRN